MVEGKFAQPWKPLKILWKWCQSNRMNLTELRTKAEEFRRIMWYWQSTTLINKRKPDLIFCNPHNKNVVIEIWLSFLAEKLLNIKFTSTRYNKVRKGNLFSLKENTDILTKGAGKGSFMTVLERRLFEDYLSTTQKY